ncbi:MAG: response regulator transcription factor [Candidatus Limnocylindria bacterium]
MKSPTKTRPRVALLSEPLIGSLVRLVLGHIDADCRLVRAPADLRKLVREGWPEILLADLDHHERAPEWTRYDGFVIPCVGLTRRRETMFKLEAYRRGAYDVIEVPFTPDEIVVRTMAAYARAHGRTPVLRARLRVEPFEMDIAVGSVRMDSTPLRLTLLEQTLLYLFLAHPGEVLDRERILANVWGAGSAVTSNVIDRHIRDLRVKLGESWRSPRFIETIPGEGYRFVGAGHEAAAPPAVATPRNRSSPLT